MKLTKHISSKKLKDTARTFVKKTAVLGVALGLLAGGAAAAASQSPADVSAELLSPTPVVQMADDIPAPDGAEDTDTQDVAENRSVRRYKAFLAGPAHALGLALTYLLSMLWKLINLPIVSTILFWLFTGLAAVGAVAAGLKAVFPDVPLKELLNKKRIGAIVASVAGLFAACSILSLCWDGFDKYLGIVRAVGSLAIVLLLAWRFAGHRLGELSKGRKDGALSTGAR